MFLQAALRAGASVIAEVEDEQENFLLHTHLFTPLALLREGGPSYSFDIDYRYNRTDEACLSTTSATAGKKTVVFPSVHT